MTGADPGYFLGGGALVSCSTSTPINYIFFFCRIPVVLENRRSSRGGGGGVRTPCTLPLDLPLYDTQKIKSYSASRFNLKENRSCVIMNVMNHLLKGKLDTTIY